MNWEGIPALTRKPYNNHGIYRSAESLKMMGHCNRNYMPSLVLFGTEFWQPLWTALRAQMLDGPRQTLSAEDLELVTITDDPAHAAELCLAAIPSS